MLFVVLICLFLPLCLYGEIHGFAEVGKGYQMDIYLAEVEVQWWLGNGNLKNELYGGWETWAYSNLSSFVDIYTVGNRVHYKDFYFQLEHMGSDTGGITTFSAGFNW